MSWRSRQTSSPPLAPPTFKSEILFQNFTPGVTNVESIRRDSAREKAISVGKIKRGLHL